MSSVPVFSTALVAAGTVVGTSLQLSLNGTKQYYQIATCTSTNNGVKLPICLSGTEVFVRNDGAYACSVYPQTGGAINSLAANASFSVPAGGVQILVCIDSLNWYVSTGSPSVVNVVSIAAATTAQTLTPTQSGSLVSVAPTTANKILTLPAAQAGLYYDFILNAAASNTVTIAAGSAIMTAQVTSSDAKANTPSVSCSNVIFAATAVKGDRVVVRSDGTSWFANGTSSVQTVITTS